MNECHKFKIVFNIENIFKVKNCQYILRNAVELLILYEIVSLV